MPSIPTLQYFELTLDKFGDPLVFSSVDVPAYKTDIQTGDGFMSGKQGAIRQTFATKRQAAVTLTTKTLASGDPKSTSSLLRGWLKECMPKSEDGSGFPAAARTSGAIKIYNSAGEVTQTWILKGVWVCKYELGQLSIDGGILEETFTLQVDQFEQG